MRARTLAMSLLIVPLSALALSDAFPNQMNSGIGKSAQDMVTASPPFVHSAQELPHVEDLLAAYGRLNAYCDKGTAISQIKIEFTRCASRDGRFKDTSHINESAQPFVVWTDGLILYQNSDSGIYVEIPLQERYPGMRDDIFLLFILRPFFPNAQNRQLLDGLVKLFSPVADANDAQFLVWEYLQQKPAWGTNAAYVIRHRLWVSREDGLIRKYEQSTSLGVNHILVELSYVDTAKSPSEGDLRSAAPLGGLLSIFMNRHRVIFVAGLFLLAFLAGSIGWLVPGFLMKSQRPSHAKLLGLLFGLLALALGIGSLVAWHLETDIAKAPWLGLVVAIAGIAVGAAAFRYRGPGPVTGPFVATLAVVGLILSAILPTFMTLNVLGFLAFMAVSN